MIHKIISLKGVDNLDSKYFLSENAGTLAKAVQQAVLSDKTANYKKAMQEGVDYYGHKHEILKYRLFYQDNEGNVREETSRSNIKIPHSYFTELVDQKVQYLLSNPIEFNVEDDVFQEHLDNYIDEDLQLVLQEMVEGASQKGLEFVYYQKTDETVLFKVADSRKIIEIYDDNFKLIAIIRYYDTSIYVDGKNTVITKAELWNEKETWYFANGGYTNQNFKLDHSIAINPRKHEVFISDDETERMESGYGFIPFLRLDNNKSKTTDLEPIKNLIDDYDLMACALSNNLQDFDQPFFAVKNFAGDSYETLINNLRSRGAVGVGDNGGLDMHVVDIPVDARKAKLEVDKEGIYKFGMGFDSSQVGDGNITNVVIQSRFSLLDLKCNKTEIRLRQLIRRMLELIVKDINERHGKAYNAKDIEVVITRKTLVNEKETVDNEKTREETKQVQIETLLSAAARIDDDTLLEKMCRILEIDYEEVKKRLSTQDYRNMNEDSEVDE